MTIVSFYNRIATNTALTDRPSMIERNKGKSVPLQSCSGPEGSRKLRFPYFMTTAQDGGKVVSLTPRPPLPPGNARGTHFNYSDSAFGMYRQIVQRYKWRRARACFLQDGLISILEADGANLYETSSKHPFFF